LSYGYRPRRRKRTKPDAERAAKSAKRVKPVTKNDHRLKALAIKKSQIHIVGTPSLKLEGIPVFLDVEGMPDREFYYLVGLRYEWAGDQMEQSFWADGPESEREIWESCLRTLKAIGNAQIVSYGAYESRFLKQMKARYVRTPDEVEFVDRLIETSVNLLGCIYGKIYFPTFSNSLKEVGRYLGYEWSWPRASGAATPLLRRAWELAADDELKRKLIGYNMDDCRAASTVAHALLSISGGSPASMQSMSARWRSASNTPSASSWALCQSSIKSTVRRTGTIRGRRYSCGPIRRSDESPKNPKTGAKPCLLRRRSRSVTSQKYALNAVA
jgi:hypothetical protein